MYTLTLIRADGSTWLVGGFASLDAANAWIANEQKQSYWDPTTQTQIDNPPPSITLA